jgi:Predicted transcriptional regulator
MNSSEKIENLLSYLGIKAPTLAANIGVEYQRIFDIQRGKTKKISGEVANKIIEKYPEINISWLLISSGEMLKTSDTSDIERATTYKSVPLLPIDAVAGFSTENTGGITYADCEQYSVPEFERSGCEFVIRVSGSSMYPKYSNGDILACKKIENILFFQWGKPYVIDSSQGALVKRVFEDKENPDNIILVSDNKENYPPFSIPKSDIRSLSIVLGVIRME